MTNLFVRIGQKPEDDLRRGFSYAMGAFGDSDQAHVGLSGYEAVSGDEADLRTALQRLSKRMGLSGYYSDPSGRRYPMFVTVYEGLYVGTGPDSEDLFAPKRLVVAVPTHAESDDEAMIERVVAVVTARTRRPNPTPPTGGTFTAYHGTSKRLKRLDPWRGAQHIVWFSGDRETIEQGESGAEGAAYILELRVTMRHPAGWREYDQLVLDELLSRGYDGAILPRGDSFDGFVFDGSQIEIVNTTALGSKRRSNPVGDRVENPAKTLRSLRLDNNVVLRHERFARGGEGSQNLAAIYGAGDWLQVLVTTKAGKGFAHGSNLADVVAFRKRGDDVFRIQSAGAVHGWGPFAYDVLMEKATELGGALAPDPSAVSDEARNVWAHYANRCDVALFEPPEPVGFRWDPDMPRFSGDAAFQKAPDLLRQLRKKGLFTETGSRLSNPASPPRSVWGVAERVRQRFIDSGYPRLRRTHIKLDEKIDNWDEGKRTVASCSADGLRMWISPRLESFDRDRQLALLAHEFGHAVQGLYGLDVPDRHDMVERDADTIAESVMGKDLFYALIDGRLIQTFNSRGGVRPRPRGLR